MIRKLLKIGVLGIFMLCIGMINAQTTLISPTGDGGFETGLTFAANNWTVVNYTTTTSSNWFVTPSPLINGSYSFTPTGTNAAYISNTNGTSWAYNTSPVAGTVHLYRDVAFPAGETNINLSFNWNANGESSYDILYVYLAPTTRTPVTGTPSGTGTGVGGWAGTGASTLIASCNLLAAGSGSNISITLPTTLAGTTKRLVFTWKSDGSGGGEPPAAIDNIKLTSSSCGLVPTGLNSTLITTSAATFSWTAGGTEPTWDVYYGTQPLTAPTASTAPTTTTSAATAPLTGLTQLTGYSIYVRANCGAGVVSSWTAVKNFTTLPTCPTPTALNTSTITGSTANFTWTPTGSETAWDLYYGTAPLAAPGSTTVPTATSASASYSATGLYSGTNYTVYVRAHCSGSDQSLWSTAKTFSTVTTCTVPTGLNAINLTGTTASYTWTAGTGTAWDVFYGVRPLTAPTVTTAPTATTGTNSYTATGLYSGTGYAVYVRANCGGGDVSNWSAVKNFSTVVTCTVPTAVTVSGITNTAATFSWTSSAAAFDVYYGSATTVPNATTVPTGSTSVNSYPATGLSALTSYSLYVRAQCGVGNTSTWTAVTGFVTACNPVSAFPFTESVPATFPSCWSANESAPGASYHWESYTNDGTNGVAGPKAGTNFMRLNVYNADVPYNTYNLISPAFVLPAAAKQIRYSYFLGNGGYKGTTGTTGADPYPLILQVSTDGGTTWTAIYSHSSSNSAFATTTSTVNWQSNAVILGAYTNQTVMFRFVANSNYGSGICNQGLDEFIIEDAPACAPPTALTVTNIAGHTAILGWTTPSTGSPANYDWEIRTTGAPGTAGATASGTVTAATTTVNTSGLAATTGYSVYVRTDCGGGTFSTWTAAQVFTTTVSCPAPTSLSVTALTPTTGVATWTAGGVEASWFVQYAAPTTTASVSTPSYALTGLTPSSNYTIQVRGYCGSGDTSAWTVNTFVTPCLPPNITSTTPGSRCGIGTTTVAATADAGAIVNWYTAATGGTATATGTVFTTPSVSVSTNYYAEAANVVSVSEVAGIPVITSNSSTNSNYGSHGIVFSTATNNVTVVASKMYINGSGTITVSLRNNSNVEISNTGPINVVGSGSLSAVSVPINLTTSTPGSYELIVASVSGGVSSIYVENSPSYPYTSPSGNISVTSGYWYGTDVNSHRYFYATQFSYANVCASTRTLVPVTVSAPPALTLSTATTVCANVVSTLSVTSTASNFDSYVWSPVANLYTDAAATTPYTGGTTTTVYYKSGVSNTSVYTVNAQNTVSGCANIASTTLSTEIPVINASANPTVVCSGSNVNLNATTNIIAAGTVTVGTASTLTGDTDPLTAFCNRYTGYRSQAIYTAAELTAAGLSAGNITSIAYKIATLGSDPTNPNFTVKTGTTTATVFTDFISNAGFTTVFPSATYTHSVGVNVIPFSTPFNWDGVSNLIIEVTQDGVDAANNAQTYYTATPGNSSVYSNYNGTTGNPLSSRLNVIFGGQAVTPAAGSLTWQWNPGAINSNTATVNPVNSSTATATTASYTITGINAATTCSNTAVVTVTVNPVPTVPVVVNSTQCGLAVPTASVSGGAAYRWYATATSTTVLQSGASANYTTAINATTTWYVSSYNANCESARAAVTETVTVPDAVTVSSTTTAVCPGNTFTLTATHIGSTNTYTYSWTATPALGSGIPTSVPGITAAVTTTTPGTYMYMVTASDAVCTTTAAVNVVVNTPPSITAVGNPSVLCSGTTVTLNGNTTIVGTGTAPLGAGTSTTTSSGTSSGNYVSPYSHYFGGYKAQYIFKASELTAAGVHAGNITSLAFNVTSVGTSYTDFAISMAPTIQNVTTTTFDPTVSEVYPANTETPVLGINTYNFSTPFNWDGTSNVVVQVTWSDNNTGGTAAEVTYDATSFAAMVYYRADSQTSASIAGQTTGIGVLNNRPQVIFGGQVFTLGASSYTWQWNPGAINSNTTSVTPVNTGSTSTHPSYTVSAVDPATTCSNTAVVTLTVNPIPTVLASASTPSVCSGRTASLTASGATTYAWLPAGGTATVAVVSPTAATVYTVTGTSLGCSSTATLGLTVNATPTVVASASPSVICAGATVSLTASGALSYTWSPISVMSATATATPTTNTTYSITGSTSGCASTKTVNVIVNHVPTLTISASSSALCTAGATATLIATGTSTAYAWSNGAITSTTAVTPSVTTIYTLTGTNVCGTSTASATIGVGTVPTLTAATSAATICTGNAAVLTVSGTATSYSWSTGAVTMSVTVTPTATTNYSVTGTSVCGSITSIVVQNVALCTGVESIMGSGNISMYPNPAHDQVNITIGSYLAANNTTVEITDALGKLVMKENLNTDVTTLRLNKLEDGIYFFKVITNNQIIKIGKVVKQ